MLYIILCYLKVKMFCPLAKYADGILLDTATGVMQASGLTGATVKHIVLNSDGRSVIVLGPSIKSMISDNSGINQIYLPSSSIVDASNLKSGRD